MQCLSRKCLPEKSCSHCVRLLVMSWLFKDVVVITKEIMFWLFKDPINSGLTQLNHTQTNSKKWPKGLKDQNAPNGFCSRKTTNKIFMYLLAPFILQNFYKKMSELIREPFLGPKQPICPEQNFMVQTIVITFIYLLAVFIEQNLKKFLQRIQNYDGVPFLAPKWSIFPKHFIFLENYHYHSHLPISPFYCTKFKKNTSNESRVMRMCNLWAKMAHFPK